MKKIKLFSILGVASLLLSGVFFHQRLESINAAGNGVDDSGENWSAIGTINGSNWNQDFPLSYDATDDRYELEIALTAGNEFKIRLNNDWGTSIGYGGKTGDGISSFLTNNGGNFKVKTTGNYVLWVKDDNVRNYGDNSYGFGIEEAAEVEYVTVTYYSETFTVLASEEIIKGSVYSSLMFNEVEGYKLEGWYTDSNLTTKFVKGNKVSVNLNLYPKYVEATDYTIYFDSSWSTVYAYMWRDSTSGDNTWPGEIVSKDLNGKHSLTIDASKSYDSIIFNNGTVQTVDLSLDGVINGDTFVIGAENSGNKYEATLKRTSVSKLLEGYYNDGTYTRNTTINLTETAVQEVETHFHAECTMLERTTYFTPEALWMTRGENSETYSYYGTSGENMTTGTATEWGEAPTSVGIVTNTHKDWDNPEEDGMEGFYITLKDIMEKSSTVEWTYNDGVYSTTGLTKEFLAFTAPCFLNFDNEKISNYFTLTSVEIEETNEGLELRLITSGDSGKLIDTANNVLSKAIITE